MPCKLYLQLPYLPHDQNTFPIKPKFYICHSIVYISISRLPTPPPRLKRKMPLKFVQNTFSTRGFNAVET